MGSIVHLTFIVLYIAPQCLILWVNGLHLLITNHLASPLHQVPVAGGENPVLDWMIFFLLQQWDRLRLRIRMGASLLTVQIHGGFHGWNWKS